jgi:thiamine-phosphate pyrophosphorylase
LPAERKSIVCYVTDRKRLVSERASDPTSNLLEKIRAALEAGVDWVQIRERDLPGGRLLTVANEAIGKAKQLGSLHGREARVYVNDRLDVALASGAAGVHLGGESLSAADVVRWCSDANAPTGFEVGVSCHSIEGAREGEKSGANYIFFGPVFDTPSKRAFGPSQGTVRLAEVARAVRIPVIAIGGVNQTNAEECIRAGASGIAAIRLFQETPDPEKLKKFISTVHSEREMH